MLYIQIYDKGTLTTGAGSYVSYIYPTKPISTAGVLLVALSEHTLRRSIVHT